MPNISNPSKLPIFLVRSASYQRLILRFISKPISTSPVPTHENISHLILEQKSPSEVLQTFRWASKLPNFTHSQSTYRALIHKLCTFRRFDTAQEVLDEMPNSIGSPPDEDIFVTIVRGLGRAKMIRQVIKVLDLVTKFGKSPSLKLFNSILDVLVKEDIDIAREFYRRKMIVCGVKGDAYTFGIMMKGLCLTNRIDECFKLLSAMKSHGLTPNTVIYNTLLHGLCKNGKVGRARSLMNELVEPNEVTFNIMISAYCREENVVQALVMLEKSFNNGFVPDVVTVTKILAILCTEDRVEEAAEVIERVESKGGSIDVLAYNTLMKGFCRKGKAKVAVSYLKEMERKGCLPNVETYNTLICGFCESGILESAIGLFDEMKMAGISRNFVTYDTLVKGLCCGGRMEHALSIIEIMEEGKGGSGGRVSPYNSIIYGFYKQNQLEEAVEFLTKLEKLFPRAVGRSFRILAFCNEGNIEEAKMVYDQMTEEGDFPSALVYATLICGFCRKDCIKEAFELMNEMVSRGFLPIASTFNGVISGLCRESKVGSAWELLENLVGRGCLPDVGSYIPIIDASCRKEDFGKASWFLQQMLDKDIVPDLSTWNLLVLSIDQECMRLKGKGIIVPSELPIEFILET